MRFLFTEPLFHGHTFWERGQQLDKDVAVVKIFYFYEVQNNNSTKKRKGASLGFHSITLLSKQRGSGSVGSMVHLKGFLVGCSSYY